MCRVVCWLIITFQTGQHWQAGSRLSKRDGHRLPIAEVAPDETGREWTAELALLLISDERAVCLPDPRQGQSGTSAGLLEINLRPPQPHFKSAVRGTTADHSGNSNGGMSLSDLPNNQVSIIVTFKLNHNRNLLCPTLMVNL